MKIILQKNKPEGKDAKPVKSTSEEDEEESEEDSDDDDDDDYDEEDESGEDDDDDDEDESDEEDEIAASLAAKKKVGVSFFDPIGSFSFPFQHTIKVICNSNLQTVSGLNKSQSPSGYDLQ